MIRCFLLACATTLASLLIVSTALADSGLQSSGPLEFGAVDIHFGGSPGRSLTVSNEPGEEMAIGKIAIAGPDAQSFSISQDYCSGQTPGPLIGCSIEVEFKAQTAGPKSATLIVHDEAGELEVPLSGSGVTGTLSSSQSPLRFSPLPYAQPEREGEGNETEQVNVLDSIAGTQTEGVSITGADASSFSINYGNCEKNLMAAGNTCDEGIRFEPRSTGTKHAVLLIESDSSTGTLEIPLEGVALEGAQLSLSSHQALLGEVTIGSSAQNVFTLTNTGDYPLFIERAFLVSGTPLMFPVLADSCSAHIVQPGASCTMTIGFQPSAPGEKSAGMILITNATPSIQVIGVDGIGVPPAVAVATPPPAILPPNNPVPTAILTTVQAARLQSGAVLHTGFLTHCPAGSSGCQILSRITTTSHARTPSGEVLLGSTETQLAAGETARAHIHLTPRSTTLLNRKLKRQGRLAVTITTEVRTGTTTLATRSRILVLLAQSSAPSSN